MSLIRDREKGGGGGEVWSTASPKQPFSFLGRLAINSYLALCQQESDCCLWQCMADSTQWGMGLQGHMCVSVFIAIKEVTEISL